MSNEDKNEADVIDESWCAHHCGSFFAIDNTTEDMAVGYDGQPDENKT